MGHSAIVIDKLDNVATAVQNLEQGDSIQITSDNIKSPITLKEPIHQGFKVALRNVNQGESIIKYGEVIGVATSCIAVGECVHVHNVEGLKGRVGKS